MITEIVSMLGDCIVHSFAWFEDCISAMGAESLLIGAFVVFASYRLLLAPLLGNASSDTARKKGSDEE